jgi:hypothetical protein
MTPDQLERLSLIHRPQWTQFGEQRCKACAVYSNGKLRRALWPCVTAVELGLDIHWTTLQENK